MAAEHGGERPAAAPPNWQDWQQWVEDVDWSDWRSWLRRIASTDWTGAPWPGTPWEQPPDAGQVSLTLRAFGEDEPGPQIAGHLRETWPGFRRWWHGGANARPSAANDLATFDAQWGLPQANLQVMKFGNVPPFDPTNTTMVGWAEETTLDVEYAHSIAPGAKIVLAETPVAEVEGTSGLPEMMNAEKSLIDRGIGDVITQSFGATENTFPGFSSGNFSSLLNLRYAFKDARAHGVTVLASSGDDGATDAESDATTLYPFRVNSWPSSDPLVTSVGGTLLNLDDQGNRQSPDVVWNDSRGAGGGGVSGVFSRPLYQAGVAKEVGSKRGTPDISMSASTSGAAWIYTSFGGVSVGWHLVGGRRPGGRSPARPDQPRALPHGHAQPGRQQQRRRGRHLRQQLLRRRHRLHRQEGL